MILVTGATGNNGREVVKQLAAAGAPVRALVRNRAKAGAIQASGVQIVEGDLGKPETLAPALDAIDTALLLSAWVENQADLEQSFIQAARRSGLKHLVKFSVFRADTNSSARIFRVHGLLEQAVAASGLDYTLLRPNSFMQNFLESAGTIGQGALYAPMGQARVSHVDIRDIAAVAVKTLTERGHEGRTYEITGPEPLSEEECAAKLSRVLGWPVSYVDITPEQFKSTLLQYGASEWVADGLNELYAVYRQGANAEVTDTVRRLTGKEPISFEQFVRDYAQVFQQQHQAGAAR